MKYPVVLTLTGQGFAVARVCQIVGVSRSGFYQWCSRLADPSDAARRRDELGVAVRKIHQDSRGSYGVRRVHAELTLGLGIAASRPLVERVMREQALSGLPTRRKYRRKSTVATSSDMLNRQFDHGVKDRVWVTDITQHPTREGVLYCAAVLDTHSRKIVGWSINSTQTSRLVTDALDMAITARDPQGTIIHSDHGSQFVSWAFSRKIHEAGLTGSMGTIGDGYDNAPIESFWGRMQTELLNTKTWTTRAELASAIFSYIEIFHNRQRRHSALNYLTPVEYEDMQLLATTVAKN
jgi:transposase InsO family protein